MLSVYDSGQKYPVAGYRDFYITHVEDGNDRLNFTVPVDADIYKRLAEENRVEYGGNYYLIKSIDAPSSYANISCSIDLDFLRANFHRTYDSGSITLSALLLSLLPSGWTVSGYNPGISRTIKMEMATDYDIVKQAANTYSVAYEWHTVEKRLVVMNPNVSEPPGEYLTDELNLRSIAFKGKTDGLVTRLYAYGKDGLTFASINGGREYVENYQYTGKTICGYWQDERYTDATSLKTDAEIMLAGLSAPERSYDCDVIDLAKLDDRYSDFVFALHKVVTLVDRKRHTRMNHKIVEYKEYPDEPEQNVLTLSTVVKDIKRQLDGVREELGEVQSAVNVGQTRQERLADMMTNTLGYYYTEETDPEGRIISYMHNQPLLSQSQWIWRRGISGFATSTDGGKTWNSGVSIDGSAVFTNIETRGLVADWIKTGTLNADLIKAGTISSKNGKSTINMDTGTANLTGSLTTISADGSYSMTLKENGLIVYRNGNWAGSIGGLDNAQFGPISAVSTDFARAKYLFCTNLYRWKSNEEVGLILLQGIDEGTRMSSLRWYIGASNTRVASWDDGSGGLYNDIAGVRLRGDRVYLTSISGPIDMYSNLDMHGNSILNQSDARLKTDIHPTDVRALDLLNQIDLQKFRWIENGEREDIGIIAQQLQEIAPDLVHENPSDGHLSIKTDKLVLYCIKAIQELSGKTESQPLELGLDPHDKWRYTRNAAKRANPKIDDEIIMEVDDGNKPDNATDMG